MLQRVLAQLQVAVGSYADPDWAAADRLADGVRGRCTTWRVGRRAGQRHPAGRGAGASPARSSTPAQLAEIAGWRDGSAPLPGLTVDTDLSWTLLGALVAHGAAGAAEIDAAAAADSTASGDAPGDHGARAAARRREQGGRLGAADQRRRHGQRPAGRGHRRLRPSGAGARCWRRTSRSTSQEVAGVWERRSIEVAQKVAVGLYPRWAIDQRTVDLARGLGRRSEHPPALRRLVSEGRAGIERALRARAADAAVALAGRRQPATGRGSAGIAGRPGRGGCPAWRTARVSSPGGALRQGAGLVGQDPDPGDQGAGDVAVGAGGHHGEHGQPGGAVADPPRGFRPGDHLDHPLARRDGQQHGARERRRRDPPADSRRTPPVLLPRSPR